jgi:hypothetical protein
MSAKSERIIGLLDTCDREETLDVAGAALGYLTLDQQIQLILETLDDDGKAELAAHLDDGDAS